MSSSNNGNPTRQPPPTDERGGDDDNNNTNQPDRDQHNRHHQQHQQNSNGNTGSEGLDSGCSGVIEVGTHDGNTSSSSSEDAISTTIRSPLNSQAVQAVHPTRHNDGKNNNDRNNNSKQNNRGNRAPSRRRSDGYRGRLNPSVAQGNLPFGLDVVAAAARASASAAIRGNTHAPIDVNRDNRGNNRQQHGLPAGLVGVTGAANANAAPLLAHQQTVNPLSRGSHAVGTVNQQSSIHQYRQQQQQYPLYHTHQHDQALRQQFDPNLLLTIHSLLQQLLHNLIQSGLRHNQPTTTSAYIHGGSDGSVGTSSAALDQPSSSRGQPHQEWQRFASDKAAPPPISNTNQPLVAATAAAAKSLSPQQQLHHQQNRHHPQPSSPSTSQLGPNRPEYSDPTRSFSPPQIHPTAGKTIITTSVTRQAGGDGTQSTYTTIPCRARGLPPDHNSQTAYFTVPQYVRHGEDLICSYPSCAALGVKFCYCVHCGIPVAKRNFKQRHDHGMNRIKNKNKEKKEMMMMVRRNVHHHVHPPNHDEQPQEQQEQYFRREEEGTSSTISPNNSNDNTVVVAGYGTSMAVPSPSEGANGDHDETDTKSVAVPDATAATGGREPTESDDEDNDDDCCDDDGDEEDGDEVDAVNVEQLSRGPLLPVPDASSETSKANDPSLLRHQNEEVQDTTLSSSSIRGNHTYSSRSSHNNKATTNSNNNDDGSGSAESSSGNSSGNNEGHAADVAAVEGVDRNLQREHHQQQVDGIAVADAHDDDVHHRREIAGRPWTRGLVSAAREHQWASLLYNRPTLKDGDEMSEWLLSVLQVSDPTNAVPSTSSSSSQGGNNTGDDSNNTHNDNSSSVHMDGSSHNSDGQVGESSNTRTDGRIDEDGATTRHDHSSQYHPDGDAGTAAAASAGGGGTDSSSATSSSSRTQQCSDEKATSNSLSSSSSSCDVSDCNNNNNKKKKNGKRPDTGTDSDGERKAPPSSKRRRQSS